MVRSCKMMISPEIFFNLIFWIVRGVKGQKSSPKRQKNYVWYAWYLTKHRLYGCHLWYTILEWYYFQTGFFIFFKIFIFLVVRRVKYQSMTHNDEKICLLVSISQEPFIMWSWFMVHMCKTVISLGVFYILPKF